MDRAAQRDRPAIAARTGRSSAALWAGLLALVIVLMLAWIFLPIKAWVEIFATWTRELGVAGVIAFAVVYIVAVTVLAPASILTLAAGFVYGAWGFPLVVASATIGATSAFLISRHFVRQRVNNLAKQKPVLEAVDKAIKDEGWQVVALMRLSPLVPFNLQNYFFGATDIGLISYIVATFFGIMPGSAMYIYLGSLGHAAATSDLSGAPRIALLVAGFAATVVTIVVVGRKAKAKLNQIGVSSERQ